MILSKQVRVRIRVWLPEVTGPPGRGRQALRGRQQRHDGGPPAQAGNGKQVHHGQKFHVLFTTWHDGHGELDTVNNLEDEVNNEKNDDRVVRSLSVSGPVGHWVSHRFSCLFFT